MSVTQNIIRLHNMIYEMLLKTKDDACIELRLPKDSGSWHSSKEMLSHGMMDEYM